MQELIINEELKSLLPPLSDEEFTGLEASILKDGLLMPLILWNDTLVDGHHRYSICLKHSIPFTVKNIVFDNIDAAKLWAWRHQDNRRNLTPFHRAEIALKLKETISSKSKERQLAGLKQNTVPAILPERSEQKETRQELAEIANVGARTLDKVEYLAENADEDTKKKLRQGEKGTSINKEYNRLKAEKKTSASATNIRDVPDFQDENESEYEENYPPLSQPIPEKDSQFVQTVKLQNIPLNDPERLIACLFDLFDAKYREKFAYDFLLKMKTDDGEKVVRRVLSKLNKLFST